MDTQQSTSWRSYIADRLLFPSLAAGVAAAFGAYFGRRIEQRHSLSIVIVPSDNAVPPEEFSNFPAELITGPDPTPTPVPNPRFTYGVIVRNDGDFSEENVAMAVAFEGELATRGPLVDPQVVFSSPLLAEAEQNALTRRGDLIYSLSISRLNPGEWVSLQASWGQGMRISAQVRSDDFSRSASQ